MALKRLSPGVYRNEKGQTVYSKDGKPATSTPGGKPSKPKPKATNPVGNSSGQKLENVTGQQLGQDTENVAGQRLADATNNAGLGTSYQLPADNRTIGADSATTARLADEAFARVNKDITRREQDERSQLQSELANRGININNPEDPTYKRFMQDLERKFAGERDQAQQSAQAQATQTQIGLGGLQETIRSGQVGESAGERNQNLAEIEQLINFGFLARKPNFTQQELNTAREALKRRNQGGGTPAPNVFNNTLAPSTPR